MRSAGEDYECQAALWLEQHQGVTLLARNFRCRAGEIDIVARDDRHLVFLEVRARSNPRYASAAASVDWRKQQRLRRAAQFYLQRHPRLAHLPCRFDVIAFQPRQSGAGQELLWIRGAFTA